MVKKILKSKLGVKALINSKKNTKIHRRSKKFKNPKHSREYKNSFLKDNLLKEEIFLEQNIGIDECINGIKILDDFISDAYKEMAFEKLPFHVNLIRKGNTGYTKYTKIYRKRMLKLIGFGNRFGPHYHKDENGHIYSMEYTDRITSKSLIFFRCQLKGCRAKGVLNANTKKFIVSQKHALPYENHIRNKKSTIKMKIEKTFAERKDIKDIQIIFCRYYDELKNKQKININNTNSNLNNNNIKNNSIKEIIINQNLENENHFSLEGKKEINNQSENTNKINNNNFKYILDKNEMSRGEIFWNYYENKFRIGENEYEDLINKIIFAKRENERENKEYLYEVEINFNDFKNNKKPFFYLEENKILWNRYHKNLNKEIYLYSFDSFDKEKNRIIFICKYKGCTGKGYYDVKTKRFITTVPHLFSYQSHYDNLYQQIDSYKKVAHIFEECPEFSDIQFILKNKQ